MSQFFKNQEKVIALISQKKDGQMIVRSKRETQNRRKFLKKYGIGLEEVVTAGLVHGKKVKRINQRKQKAVQTDGLVTDKKRVFLSVTVSDCLPIYFFDPDKKAVGIAHAGWRGLVKNIPQGVVQKMEKEFQSNPQNILLVVGPGLSFCHFEIKEDVLQKFKDFPEAIIKKENKFFLDPKKVALKELQASGIKRENITISPECTFCLKNKYFSYRRDAPDKVSSMLAVIGLVK